MRISKLLFLTVLLSFTSTLDAISIQDALKKKAISVTISSTGRGSYYGECIKINIKNNTNRKINVEILSGQFLNPDDSTTQRMMIAEQMVIALNQNASQEKSINAFCTQRSHSSTKSTTSYKIGKIAMGTLLSLTKIIEKNRFFSKAGQNAIWCITNNQDIYSINGETDNETKILREFVSKATGQELRKVYKKSPRSSQQETTVKDSVNYYDRDGGIYSLVMYDEEGEEILVFFKDRKKKAGQHTTLTFSLTYASFPLGTYYIRLTKDNGEVVYNKEVKIID